MPGVQFDLGYIVLAAIGSLISIVTWLVRMDAKIKRHDEKHEEIEEKEVTMWTKIDEIRTQNATIIQKVTRVETQLEHITRER